MKNVKTKEQIKKELIDLYYKLGSKRSAYYFRGVGTEKEMEDIAYVMRSIDRDLDLIEKGINPQTGKKFGKAV